jgi:hypothetical protein
MRRDCCPTEKADSPGSGSGMCGEEARGKPWHRNCALRSWWRTTCSGVSAESSISSIAALSSSASRFRRSADSADSALKRAIERIRHPVDRQSARRGRSGCARERQGTGARPAQTCLAHHHVPGRLGRSAALALCPRAGAHRTDQSHRRTPGRDVERRIVQGHDVLQHNAQAKCPIEPNGARRFAAPAVAWPQLQSSGAGRLP